MLVGLVFKHIFRKRLKLLFTTASQRTHTGYIKWLIGQMDHIIAISAKTGRHLERPADVILHGIDTAQFTPPPDRTALRTKFNLPDARLIGCYGRIRAQKGTGDFVDAMIPVLQVHLGVHGIIMDRATEKHADY